jgi:hypothetical protein
MLQARPRTLPAAPEVCLVAKDIIRTAAYTSWHRHVTLAALAQAFCTMIRTDPRVLAPG